MSTIVSVEKDGRTVVAYDDLNCVSSVASVGASATKAFRVGDSVVATAGFATYQVVLPHYVRTVKPAPPLSTEMEVLDFFLEFWRALRKGYHFVDDSSDNANPSPFADLDSEFLVSNRHGIFRVKEILSVLRFDRFCAIGSGSSHAEGVMEALYCQTSDSRSIAIRAVEIACKFDLSSGGSVQVIEIE